MTSSRTARILTAAATSLPAWLSAACGAAAHQAAPADSPGPHDGMPTPDASHPNSVPIQWQDPVCGIGLGNVAGLSSFAHYDITNATPSPITDAAKFVLRITPDCDHGDYVRISPPSAASITRRAPAADGLDTGGRIESLVPGYRIIGTGAVPFDQQVHVTCLGMGPYCPTDPRYAGPPTPTPATS